MARRLRHTGIAVIEGPWDEGQPVSVQPLFDLLATLHSIGPEGVYFERVPTAAAFLASAARLSARRAVRFIYVSAHGGEDGLEFCDENDVATLAELAAAFPPASGAAGFRGLHLGTCRLGDGEGAAQLLAACPGLAWVSGYAGSPGWAASAAFDLGFFDLLLAHAADPPRQRIEVVAERLLARGRGFVAELGFGVFVRRRGRRGAVRNLMAPDAALSQTSASR